jgi:hypothetical protein
VGKDGRTAKLTRPRTLSRVSRAHAFLSRLLLIGSILLAPSLFGAVIATAGPDELDQVLRAWIMENVTFEKGQENRETLFIRKRPVRAYIRSDDAGIVAGASSAIANLADAFGLKYEFGSTRVNLLIATAERITDDKGLPDRALLRSLGLTEAGADHIAVDANAWSTGCGLYDSRGDDGRLSVSIAVAEKSLATKNKLRSCVVTGVLFSFGLRIKGKTMLEDPNDYIQFLLLARAITYCENQLGAENAQTTPTREAYLQCLVGRLKVKLSE